MRWLSQLWAWFVGLFRRTPKGWPTEVVNDLPTKPRRERVYLVGEGDYLWFVAFVCPCGCDELIQLNLLPDARPRWSVERLADGTASITPSVWRVAGCRSHFFLRRGRVEWCPSGSGAGHEER